MREPVFKRADLPTKLKRRGERIPNESAPWSDLIVETLTQRRQSPHQRPDA
jgi:hypothetical protein